MRSHSRRVLSIIAGVAAAWLALSQMPGLSLSPTPAHAAGLTIYVDDDDGSNNGSVSCPTTLIHSLTAGVAAAGSGNATIYVCPGTYNAGVSIISKTNLKLIGKGDVFVNAPAGFTSALIFVSGSTDVTVQGLVIDGGGTLGSNASYAIYFQNSSGAILRNRIVRWHQANLASPTYSAWGIYVTNYSDKSIKVERNSIFNVQTYGMDVITYGKATITRNLVVTTSRGTTYWPAGLRLAGATSGSVTGNTFRSDADLDVDSNYALGVILIETTGIKVASNSISGFQTGIEVVSFCNYGGSADGNKVTGNKLYDNGIAIIVFATRTSSCAPTATTNGTNVSSNKIYSNSIDHSTAISVGVGIGPAEVVGTIIKKNTIVGYGPDPISDVDAGVSGTVKSGNKVTAVMPPGA